MAYELLYSRSIASDDRVRFTDVPITSASIMVDVLSLRSPYYRLAGYAYSIVSDGVIDYERGAGYTLPFGKNRLLFPNSPLPYYLEFFPKWGTKQAIISVYTGQPSPPVPSHPWRVIPAYDIELRLSTSPARIEYRTPIGSSIIQSLAIGATTGAVSGRFIAWKRGDGSVWYTGFGSLQEEFADTQESNDRIMADPNSIVL